MKYYSNVAVEESPHVNRLYTLNTESFSIEVDPIDKNKYVATAETAALGAITLAKVETKGAIVTRKNELALDPAHQRFSLVYAFDGDLVISHHKGVNALKKGEFILMDNSHPRTMFVYNKVSLFLVSVPWLVLQRYIPQPEELEVEVLGANCHMECDGEALFNPLLSLWEHIKKGGLKEFAPVLSDKFLSSIAQVYSRYFRKQGSMASRRISEVKQLIEVQLGNPELSVESLAGSMHVSSRYLRSLFSTREKISSYILRRRLEECATQLANTLQLNASITAIAFKCGFSSTAHFSRVFKKQYGTTPREYRKTHMKLRALQA